MGVQLRPGAGSDCAGDWPSTGRVCCGDVLLAGGAAVVGGLPAGACTGKVSGLDARVCARNGIVDKASNNTGSSRRLMAVIETSGDNVKRMLRAGRWRGQAA